MKKGLLVAAVAALTFALAAPVTVLAVDSPKGPSIEITKETEADGIKVGMTGEDVDKAWGTSIGPGYEVVFVGDAHVVGEGDASGLKLTVNASDFNGGEIFVHHKKKTGGNDVGATVTLYATDLSPVCTLKKVSDSKVPNTGDSNNNVLWISALVIALVCGGAAFAMRKTNA